MLEYEIFEVCLIDGWFVMVFGLFDLFFVVLLQSNIEFFSVDDGEIVVFEIEEGEVVGFDVWGLCVERVCQYLLFVVVYFVMCGLG